MFTIKLEQKIGLPGSESAIRFATGSTVPTICLSEKSDRCFAVQTLGAREPAIVPSHWGRYLVITVEKI